MRERYTLKRRLVKVVARTIRRWPWAEHWLVRLCHSAWARQFLKVGAIAYAYLSLETPELRLAKLQGYRLWVNLVEYQGIFLYFFGCSLEPFTSEIATRLVKPGQTCIDLGANIGSYTFLLAQQVGPTGQVYAFEPQPNLYELLQRSVAANHWGDRIQLEPYAVSAQSHQRLRLYTSGDSGNSGITSMVRYGEFLSRDRFIEPETMALDDYCYQQPISDCHLLKIDIEGAELLALQGAQTLLAKQRVHHLLIEQAAGSSAQQLLLDWGYQGWFIDETQRQLQPLEHLEPGCFGNYLFVRAQDQQAIAQQFTIAP
ncbi:MAG: FkbM family methyltransferase [Cyanobacteria bacterium P01_G01_bin.54]